MERALEGEEGSLDQVARHRRIVMHAAYFTQLDQRVNMVRIDVQDILTKRLLCSMQFMVANRKSIENGSKSNENI